MNTPLRLLAGALAVAACGLVVLGLRDEDRPPEPGTPVVLTPLPDLPVGSSPPAPAATGISSVLPQPRAVVGDEGDDRPRDGDDRVDDDRHEEDDDDRREDDRGDRDGGAERGD